MAATVEAIVGETALAEELRSSEQFVL